MRKVLLLLVLCAFSPSLWQPLWGQSPGVGKKTSGKKENISTDGPSKPTADQRGTKDTPLVIDTEGHKDSPAEAEEKTREKKIKDKIDSRSLISTEIMAGATLVLMFVGIGGVGAAVRTLWAIEGQLTEMQEAGKQATKHLGLTERPWIFPTVSTVSPLTVDEHGIHIMLRIETANLGKSPAMGVWVNPRFYFPVSGRELATDINRISQESKAAVRWGRVMFPTTTQPLGEIWGINASPEDVKKAVITDDMYAAMIVVCVGYRSTIDESARHVTTVIYDLTRIDPDFPNLRSMLRTGAEIPLDQLRLSVSALFGPVAE